MKAKVHVNQELQSRDHDSQNFLKESLSLPHRYFSHPANVSPTELKIL